MRIRILRGFPSVAPILMGTGIAFGQTPNDPDFSLQWGLLNNGQAIEGENGIPGSDISATEAWKRFEPAADVVVAIVGAGVDPHPEFAERLLEGHVTSLAGGDPYSTLDTTGHGTRAAGIIAAARNNGVGIAGLNDRAWILPVRALTGNTGSEASVAEGIVWAVDAGAKVIVVPLQLYEGADVLSDALEHAFENDVVVVAPTGHQPSLSVAYPAALEHCFAVASTDNRGQVAGFSNYGPEVDLAAPGVGIWSTQVGGGYGLESAPSSVWAAAYVGGVASMIRSQFPIAEGYIVEQILIESADSELKAWQRDDYLGYGRLNAAVALSQTSRPDIRFLYDEPQPSQIDPYLPTILTVHVVDAADQVLPDSVTAHVRLEGQEFNVPMSAWGKDRYAIVLPGIHCGDMMEFGFSAESANGSVVSDPWQRPTRYSATAVRTTILFEDDFETSRGWTSTVEGGASTGAWTRLQPQGAPSMPPFDFTPDTGHRCYVTGTTLTGSPGANDVDFGPVRLVSPLISLPSADAEVSYAKWFYTASGTPDALLVEMSRDDGGTWQLVETVSQTTPWETRTFRLSDFPSTIGSTFRLRFTAADSTNDSVTEAAIDDVRVVALDCALHPGDIDGDGVVFMADVVEWTTCLSGPRIQASSNRCLRLGTGDDSDADLADLQDALTHFGR